MYYHKNVYCLIIFYYFINTSVRGDSKSREKRFLYGPFGVIQLILGFGVPVPDLLTPSTSLGYFVRGVYALPKNASDYTNPQYAELTRGLPITRWDIYHAFEKDSEIRGHGGRHCVLRAICDAATIPVDKYHGFFEEVFYSIFTPTSTSEKIRDHSDNEYLAAYDLGKKSKGMCKTLFPDCKTTFLDLFTKVFTHFDID